MEKKVLQMNYKFFFLSSIISFSVYTFIYKLYKRYKKNKNKSIMLKQLSTQSGIFPLMKNTPMIYIKSLSELTGCKIYAKCEYYMPYTSKDRMIKNIIETAIK
jgi:cysteine synthase A